MNPVDEPALGPTNDRSESPGEVSLPERIRDLVEHESYAVLATQGDTQPYGSVIALVVSADLTQAAFCTSRATRKYGLLEQCDRVALVIDDRSKHGDDIQRVSAVTATGRAAELAPGPNRDHWQAELLARHPYLEEFLVSPSCAIFLVDIVRYLHVARFQEVSPWVPQARG
jgi:nitroimidazol reductase NimA-like FMN-containing flavoprotein (pyridoxamine 5'-phosphate oxidase superfamily)